MSDKALLTLREAAVYLNTTERHMRRLQLVIPYLYGLAVEMLEPAIGDWPVDFDPVELRLFHVCALAAGVSRAKLTVAHLVQVQSGRLAVLLGLADQNSAEVVEPP